MGRRAQGSQIFKQNRIILICSRVIAFLVICCPLLSLHYPHIIPTLSPLLPHHPHIVPMSSPSSPHCPHTPYAMLSPCCVHIIPVVSTSSQLSPHHCHIISVISKLFQHCLESPHIIPNPPPIPTPPTPPKRGPRISKNPIRFELIEIFQFCLKI